MASKTTLEGELISPAGDTLFSARQLGKTAAVSQIAAQAAIRLTNYGWRLFWTLVALAQYQIIGRNLSEMVEQSKALKGKIDIGPLGHVTVEVPIRSLLTKGSTRYKEAKLAVEEMMHNSLGYERPVLDREGNPVVGTDGEVEYGYFTFQWLNECRLNVKPGVAVLEVNRNTWAMLLDLSKGFKLVDAQTARELPPVAARLFILLTGQKVLTMSIQGLRHMFGMDEMDPLTGEYLTYPSTHNFIKRVIDPAIEELNRSTQFEYKAVKQSSPSAKENRGRRGKKAITSIKFSVSAKKPGVGGNKPSDLSSILDTFKLNTNTKAVLTNVFKFSEAGIRNNLKIFYVCAKVGLEPSFMNLVKADMDVRQINNPQGYLISRLKLELSERFHVQFDESGLPVFDECGNPVLEA